tara:strand:- start:4652 stop:4969 length:318 start_codon:yes stop_codon:yes gene_type:complete
MMTNKRIVFEDSERRHADLKIRLNYDGLTQTDFFRGIITGYLNGDENIMELVARLQEAKSTHSKTKRAKSRKLRKDGDELMKKLGIAEHEVENIYDLLEKENPEL